MCACVEVSCPANYYWYHFYLYSAIIVELYGMFERFVDCMYVVYDFHYVTYYLWSIYIILFEGIFVLCMWGLLLGHP